MLSYADVKVLFFKYDYIKKPVVKIVSCYCLLKILFTFRKPYDYILI